MSVRLCVCVEEKVFGLGLYSQILAGIKSFWIRCRFSGIGTVASILRAFLFKSWGSTRFGGRCASDLPSNLT